MGKQITFPAAAAAEPVRGKILLVQADPRLASATAVALDREGHEVTTAHEGREALRLVRGGAFDVVMADWYLPDMTGVDLFDRLQPVDADLPVVLLTDAGDIDQVIQAMRHGAYDYLAKPLHLQNLVLTVRHGLEHRRLRSEIGSLRRQVGCRDSFGSLIGRSEPMQALFRRIARISSSGGTVLVLGESGTGKEMVAREIHQRSPRASGPFIPVNCGGVPAELIESELYGHERGAFTGAVQARDGLFQAASNGTLFLDEIGAMPPSQQATLLRALDDKQVRRLGGTASHKVDVRVIAATNSDLERAMEEASFRQDLYYRLSSMVLRLPPLRDRVADIPLLAQHFLDKFRAEHGRPPLRFSPHTLDLLCNRAWPGNARELSHVIEQAVLFARTEVIRPDDLPLAAGGQEAEPLHTLGEVERQHIRRVLTRTAGNKLKAARILGIPRPTLYRRMRKLGIADPPAPSEVAAPPAPAARPSGGRRPPAKQI